MKVYISIICLLTIAFCATPDFNNQGTWEGTCNINPKRQSPIDIPCFDHINKCPSLPTYKTYWNDPTSSFGGSTKYDLTTTMKDGHWVQFTNGSGSYLFKSAQFHLHAPSEHTINGQSYPLQMHIVHVLADSPITEYLVVGFLFQVDATITHDPFTYTAIESAATINDLFPFAITNKPAYHYLGSLTTPTCLQAVNWFLQTEPIKLTQAKLDAIKAKINGGARNNRDVQPLNGRTVYLVGNGC